FPLAGAANAQTCRGTINGTVSDPSGGSVPNATGKATETATGIDHTTTTTSDGAFAFQDIPLGQYKITVTATGFPAYTVDKVEVSAGQIYTLSVKLSLQQQTTTVEVSAAALTLDTTTQTQTTTIPDDVVPNIVLKSGTNDIHGSVYYYNRNEVFGDPSPFFVPAPGTKAPRERNENYGFSAGGPIIKNKTFAFASYEKNDFVFGLSGIATEPSDAWVTLATDLLNNPVCAPITATCTTRKYGNYNPVTRSAVSTNAIGTSGFWPSSGSSSIAGLSATPGNV